jgi:hypothetical protein
LWNESVAGLFFVRGYGEYGEGKRKEKREKRKEKREKRKENKEWRVEDWSRSA